MDAQRILFWIKLFHTAIYVFMTACTAYIFYCGITGLRNGILFAAIGFIFLEGLVLLLNKFQCPLTTLALRYGYDHERFSDIFLPRWFTPFIVPLYTTFFLLGLALVLLHKP